MGGGGNGQALWELEGRDSQSVRGSCSQDPRIGLVSWRMLNQLRERGGRGNTHQSVEVRFDDILVGIILSSKLPALDLRIGVCEAVSVAIGALPDRTKGPGARCDGCLYR